MKLSDLDMLSPPPIPRTAWQDPELDGRLAPLDEEQQKDIYDASWTYFRIPGYPEWAGIDVGRAHTWRGHRLNPAATLADILHTLGPHLIPADQQDRLLAEAYDALREREDRNKAELTARLLAFRAERRDGAARKLLHSFDVSAVDRDLGGRITVILDLLRKHGL